MKKTTKKAASRAKSKTTTRTAKAAPKKLTASQTTRVETPKVIGYLTLYRTERGELKLGKKRWNTGANAVHGGNNWLQRNPAKARVRSCIGFATVICDRSLAA